jgi:hypothetical protein
MRIMCMTFNNFTNSIEFFNKIYFTNKFLFHNTVIINFSLIFRLSCVISGKCDLVYLYICCYLPVTYSPLGRLIRTIALNMPQALQHNFQKSRIGGTRNVSTCDNHVLMMAMLSRNTFLTKLKSKTKMRLHFLFQLTFFHMILFNLFF